jgi:hypothetical protein
LRRRNVRTAGFLGIENKFYDTSLFGHVVLAPADAAGGEANPSATICLNSVTQGDGESQRDGRKIAMNGVSVNGFVNYASQTNQTATDTAPVIYIALVLDRQCNATLLNSEDVFCNPSANAALAANPYRNLQYSKRFKVLASALVTMRDPEMVYDGTNIEQAGSRSPFRFDVKLAGLGVTYTGTTESIANIVDNSLSIVVYAGNITTAPTLSYNARLRFVG